MGGTKRRPEGGFEVNDSVQFRQPCSVNRQDQVRRRGRLAGGIMCIAGLIEIHLCRHLIQWMNPVEMLTYTTKNREGNETGYHDGTRKQRYVSVMSQFSGANRQDKVQREEEWDKCCSWN